MCRRHVICQTHVAVRLAALCCLLLLPTALRAQQGVTPSDARRMGEREMQDREYALYHAGEPLERTAAPPVVNMLPQMREDFKQMQLANNGLMKQVVTAQTLDYKLIAQAMGEINKRAGRLKDSLVLPQTQPAAPDNARKDKAQSVVAPDAAQFKAALFALDRLIMSFVTNPQFTSVNTLTVTHADQAGRDLRDILELSRTIRKNAQQFGK